MRTNFIEELKWRGMLQDIMPGTEELLNKEMVTGYIGFDPTAESLGIGNMVQIMTLLHFQKAGHKPVALVGGATGMVGDPSGKSAERNLLDEATLEKNIAGQRKQLEKFLDFSGSNGAEIVNNYDWFKGFSFLEFIRDVGKHISVNYMMAKDSVKNRLENGMSFTEFSYQLVQGYDFFYLWKNRNVKLQMGGSDQWGNIVTGTELIRRKAGGEAFALTTPLIKKADGTKFGKTEGGNIWLDKEKTSVADFKNFWISASDQDIKTYFRIFSLKNREEVEALEKEHDSNPGKRVMQKELAKEITVRVHSKEEYDKTEGNVKLFSIKTLEEYAAAYGNDEGINTLSSSGITTYDIPESAASEGINIITLLADCKELESKSNIKRLITAGALSVNFKKITGTDYMVGDSDKIGTGKKQFIVKYGNGKFLLFCSK
ncbi:MAG: tyrosine--tRNA ligase [Bacteroidia bacterium]